MSDEYALPRELICHASRASFAPDELREACRSAGGGVGPPRLDCTLRPPGRPPRLSGRVRGGARLRGVARGAGGRGGASALGRWLAGEARRGPREARYWWLRPVI